MLTPEKKDSTKPVQSDQKKGLIQMIHQDGRKALVHESMISAYKSGGYKEVK